jgi:hypothetical protein
MFTYPTLLISYVYTVLYTIYCILPMPFCTYVHILYPFTLVRLDYTLVITALSELKAQAFRYTRINIC